MFSRQLGACKEILAWTRQAQRYVAQLMMDPAVAHQWGIRLLEWKSALAALERDAAWHLRSATAGLLNPAGLAGLLTRAPEAMTGFSRFLQEQRFVGREFRGMDGEKSVPIGEHTLPPLPYAYNALEPHIDEQTMRLHHDKHHRTYVDGLNKAERMMAQARESGDFDLLKHWEREAAFNGAGHYLHTIFWNVMKPRGGGEPQGNLAQRIATDFGSFDRFKQHFSAAAEKVEGSGWALLVWSPRARRLEILQAEKHQNLSQWDVIPLLVLDVWEHSYYLKYNDNRRAYIDAWWNVVNWDHVAERFERARTLQWEPF